MFESEGDLFYFSPDGGDITQWTQKRFLKSKEKSGVSLEPAWHRVDPQFVWNHHIQNSLIRDALNCVQLKLPVEHSNSKDTSTVDPTVMHAHVRCLERWLPPVINGFFECEEFELSSENALPQPLPFLTTREDTTEATDETEKDSQSKNTITVKITLISRRSHLRAGRF